MILDDIFEDLVEDDFGFTVEEIQKSYPLKIFEESNFYN